MNGTVDNVSHARAAIYNTSTGTLTIDGGTYTRSEEAGASPSNSGGNSYYVILNNGTIADIKGNPTVCATGKFSSLICNCGSAENQIAEISKITNGTFTNNFVVLKNDDFSKIGTIENGTFTSGSSATQTSTVANYGTIEEIQGGEFKNEGEGSVVRCSTWAYTDSTKNNKVYGTIKKISGGTFTAGSQSKVLFLNKDGQNGATWTDLTKEPSINIEKGTFNGKITVSDGTKLTISGGEYHSTQTVDSKWISSGYCALFTDDNVYKIILNDSVNVTLNKSTESLYTNFFPQTLNLTASVTAGSESFLSNVTWSSDNKEAATVNEQGLVTAAGNGTARITATEPGSGQSATCTVTVTTYVAPPVTDTPTPTPTPEETETPTPTPEPTKIPVVVEVEPEKKDDGTVVIPDTITKEQEENIEKVIETATSENVVVIEVPQAEGVAPAVTTDLIKKAVESNVSTLEIKATPVDEKDTESVEATFTMDVSAGTEIDESVTAINTGIKATVNETAEKVAEEKLPAEAKTMKLELAHNGAFPVPVKITLNTGDQFNPGETVYLYYINETTGELEMVGGTGLIVASDRTVSFTLAHASAYVLSDKKETASETPSVTPTPTPQVLAVPTGIKTASASYNSIKITWKKVTGAASYQVYRATSKTGKYSKVGTVKTNSFTNKKLTTGKNYYYKVRALNSDTASKYSSIVKGIAKPATPAVTARAGKKAVTLTWKKVSGATGYTVYRATSKNGKYKRVKTITSGKTVKYTDKKLKSGKTYYYKVRANRKVSGKTTQSRSSKVVYKKAK